VQGQAAGNLIDITTMNDTMVRNNQLVGPGATIGSDVTAKVGNVGGSVGIQNQTVCNGASVSADPTVTAITSSQECRANDPSSQITAKVGNVAGDVGIAGVSIGNSLEADSNAPNMPIHNSQINAATGTSTVNATVHNVSGAVGVSSSAVGNTAQIIHYSTN